MDRVKAKDIEKVEMEGLSIGKRYTTQYPDKRNKRKLRKGD